MPGKVAIQFRSPTASIRLNVLAISALLAASLGLVVLITRVFVTAGMHTPGTDADRHALDGPLSDPDEVITEEPMGPDETKECHAAWDRFPLDEQGYTSRHATKHFCIASSARTSLELLGEVAEETFNIASRWLLLEMDSAPRRLPVLLCRNVEDVFAIERHLGLPYAGLERRRSFRAGYYAKRSMIVVVDSPLIGPGRICHEVGHYAVSFVTNRSPRVIAEGLAEYVRSLVVNRRPECAPAARRATLRRRSALRAGGPEELRAMFRLDLKEFTGARHYTLGWCLGKVLYELDEQRPGIVRKLLDEFEHSPGRDSWKTFCVVCPEELVENRWNIEIRALRTSDAGD